MRNVEVHVQSGFTLIEVLVTVIIIAIGLLGLAGLQMASLNNQFEAYQRTQALMLAEDMANRIRVNSEAARDGVYADADNLGKRAEEDCGDIPPDSDGQLAERDLCDWNIALLGSGVTLSVEGADEKVGSVTAARGCIENLAGSADGDRIVRITVAWLGQSGTVAPASTCGQDTYGDDDAFRRTVSVDVVLADLAL